MRPDQKFRVCILGAGDVVKYVHLPATVAHPSLDLAGIAARTATRAAALAREGRYPVYTNWRLALHECSPDIVVIAVPNMLHADMVAEALNQRCHVLVEKPAVVRLSDGRQLASIARERGLVIMVNMTMRFLESIRAFVDACRAILDMPSVRLSMRYHVSRPSPAWYFDAPARGGGILANIAIHPIDLATVLGGMPLSSLRLTATSIDEVGAIAAIDLVGRGACGLEFSADVSWQAESLDATFIARDRVSTVELVLLGNRWSLRCGNRDWQSGSVWQDMVENTALREMTCELDGSRTRGGTFEEHLSLLETLSLLTARR
jgi:predicted dehydrogenase